MKFISCLIVFATFITISYARAKQCDTGKIKKDDCNTCICDSNGMWVCTSMLCETQPSEISNEVLKRRSEVESPAETSQPSFKCAPNSFFKDDCNSCWCDRTGTSARCTLMACPPRKLSKRSLNSGTYQNNLRKKQTSSPQNDRSENVLEAGKAETVLCDVTQFGRKGCELCQCVYPGKWNCVPFFCNEPNHKIEVDVTAKQKCIQGIHKHANCQCTDTGVWDCSVKETSVEWRLKRTETIINPEKLPLPDRNQPKEVSNNSEHKLHIDTQPIKSTTTERAATEASESGDSFTPEELVDENFKCKPNKSFKMECNTCWCRADGKGPKYCTRIACHPKTYKPLID